MRHLLLGTIFIGCEAPKTATPTAGSAAAACQDLSGSWEVVEVIDRSGCGEAEQTVRFPLRWEQKGCAGTLSVPLVGIRFDGSVEGTQIKAGGTYRDFGEIEKNLILNVTDQGEGISGTATWTWRPGKPLSCNGTSTVQGKRS